MVSTFVDTSALLAVLHVHDADHTRAGPVWEKLLREGEDLITSNYVLVEVHSLVQARLRLQAVGRLEQDIIPALRIRWVDEGLHATAVASVLAAAQRKLSLVDCSSFAVMQEAGIRRVFALDRHFEERGFELVA